MLFSLNICKSTRILKTTLTHRWIDNYVYDIDRVGGLSIKGGRARDSYKNRESEARFLPISWPGSSWIEKQINEVGIWLIQRPSAIASSGYVSKLSKI